jgi:Ca-activated chloride channel family protein
MTSPVTYEKIIAERMPRMIVAAQNESALPLEHTTVSAQISAGVASVLVAQRFGNPWAEAIDLEYIYPLPHEAAVTDFSLRIGARTVRADIQELKQAQETFDNAREAGQHAGLLKQHRPNLFGLELANILPGETITAEVRYQQRLSFNEDGYEFVFPMGITPKYDSPAHLGEGDNVHAPLARKGEVVGLVELNMAVDAGVACADPSSPTHPLDVSRLDERRFQLRLAGEHIPDHDFVLRYTVSGELPVASAWSSPAPEGDYFMAAILPPRAESEPLAVKREFIFVLDRSGSMSGEPIVQARNALRACLRSLNGDDTFRVLLFDDQLEWYQPEGARVSQQSVDAADAFLAQVDARGGTEIVAALQSSLELPADPARTRFLVFLTDGAVSADARTLEALRRKLGSARIFTFGIGPSVNRALLAQMARFGRGEAEFLQADEDIEGAIIRFQDRVSFPALTEISLRWKDAKAWDIYPERLPDLYIGQPLLICGRWKASGQAAPVLLVSGKRGEVVFETEVSLPQGQPADPTLARLWARARVDELLDQAMIEPGKTDSIRATVIGLALEHRLATTYTAFVAVDEQPGAKKGQQSKLVRVAQPLPAGLDINGFQGMLPQAAPPMMSRSLSDSAAMPFPVASPSPMKSTPKRASAKSSPGNPIQAFIREVSMKFSAAPDAFESQAEELAPVPSWGGSAPLAEPAFLEIEKEGIGKQPATQEEGLRLLARTQQLDGSWGGDVERSAAAVLAFVRAGHTTRSGSFRQALRRGLEWLAGNPGSGFASFARARALSELAQATGDARQTAVAAQVQAALAAPSTPLEAAFTAPGRPAKPTKVEDLDGLRLAGLAGGPCAVPAALLSDELAQAWAALLF